MGEANGPHPAIAQPGGVAQQAVQQAAPHAWAVMASVRGKGLFDEGWRPPVPGERRQFNPNTRRRARAATRKVK